jgi:hypothetical protein
LLTLTKALNAINQAIKTAKIPRTIIKKGSCQNEEGIDSKETTVNIVEKIKPLITISSSEDILILTIYIDKKVM